MLSCNIRFSAPSFWMGDGLQPWHETPHQPQLLPTCGEFLATLNQSYTFLQSLCITQNTCTGWHILCQAARGHNKGDTLQYHLRKILTLWTPPPLRRSTVLSTYYRGPIGIAQSVLRLTTGWTVRGSNPGGDEIFRTRPYRPWGPSSLL